MRYLASMARGLNGLGDEQGDMIQGQINALLGARASAKQQYRVNHFGGLSPAQFAAYISGLDAKIQDLQDSFTGPPSSPSDPARPMIQPPPKSAADAAAGTTSRSPAPPPKQTASMTPWLIGGAAVLTAVMLKRRRG